MEDRKITKELILAEAQRLLDEEGLDKVSMRRLAARLGVRASTLYWHIPDKSYLLAEIIHDLFEQCFALIRPCDTWQDWMRQFGRAIWEVQLRTPYAALLISATDLDEAHFNSQLTLIQNALAAWPDAPVDLFKLQSAVQSLMTGWSTFAHTPYVHHLERQFPLKDAAFESLDALIGGWEQRAAPA